MTDSFCEYTEDEEKRKRKKKIKAVNAEKYFLGFICL
jgi:hypothetical protein